ncbi:phage head-tail connector protein [Cecembia sp.]|uniref:phage head-tail connector protein n=1 Tax=Cecembia sp. TaxID=1898110 RepID=UPI0025C0B6E7|nr:phage head-tail connector protein [Cecembia sp.]
MSILSDVLLAPEVEDEPEGYIASLITQAKDLILEYTRISAWPDDDSALDSACVRLVLHMYRLGGTEHASVIGMGDMQITTHDIPPTVLAIINRRRRFAIAEEEDE